MSLPHHQSIFMKPKIEMHMFPLMRLTLNTPYNVEFLNFLTFVMFIDEFWCSIWHLRLLHTSYQNIYKSSIHTENEPRVFNMLTYLWLEWGEKYSIPAFSNFDLDATTMCINIISLIILSMFTYSSLCLNILLYFSPHPVNICF